MSDITMVRWVIDWRGVKEVEVAKRIKAKLPIRQVSATVKNQMTKWLESGEKK